jgi:hypothetical protein
MRNRGTHLLGGQGTIRLTRKGSTAALLSGLFPVGILIPGLDLAYPIRWMQSPPTGAYHAHVTLAWRGGWTSWDGDLNVSPAPAPGPGHGYSSMYIKHIAAATSGGSTASVPYGVFIGTVASLVGVLLVLIVLLLRRQEKQTETTV